MLNKNQDAVQLQKILTRGQALADIGHECRLSADGNSSGACSNPQHGESTCLMCSIQREKCVRNFIRELPVQVDSRTLTPHRQCYSCSLCVYKCGCEGCITCGQHLGDCICSSASRKRRITLFEGRLWDHDKQIAWTPWRIPDGNHGLCRCCEECQDSLFSGEDCQCAKCKSCGDCVNFCDEVQCERCGLHAEECECDGVCECCDDCSWALLLESKCECVSCETCGECENTCEYGFCKDCKSHLEVCICNKGLTSNQLPLPSVGNVASANGDSKTKWAFRLWSTEEKSIVRSLFANGMSLADMAEHLSRTENSVMVQLANQGLVSDVDLSNAVHRAQLRRRKADPS